MSSPFTVSVEVPYADNEHQFLILAVKAAMRTFRNMTASSADRAIPLSSSHTLASTSSSLTAQPQKVVKEI